MGSYSIQEKLQMAKLGHAMPGGKHPVKNVTDLVKEKQLLTMKPELATPEVKAHLVKRANDLRSPHVLPSEWTMNGAKQSDDAGDILRHDDETPTSAVIVALPAPLDPSRLVGPEDKHATLLYFGETAKLSAGAKNDMLKTAAQVANMMSTFSARVTNIQRLGSDNPPALVAMLDPYPLQQLRNALLVNPQMNTYLANSPQFPTYQPHLTFGYPDYFGEDDMRRLAASLWRINFDRIAVWWNGEQTEFSLSADDNDVDDDSAEVAAMSASVGKVLAHYGVKGMKWGIRNASSQAESEGHHHSEDAKRSEAAKAKIKESGGTHALSNKELQDVVTRMNLEKQYSSLSTKKSTVNKGHEKVKSILAVGATANAAYAFAKSPAGKALAEALKKKK